MKRSLLLGFFGLLTVLFAQTLSPTSPSSRRATTPNHRSHTKAARNRLKAAAKTPPAATAVPRLSQNVQTALPQYTLRGSANLAPASPVLTAVDPFAYPANPSDPLKPARPFWYSVNQDGLTILALGSNTVVHTVPWPQTIDVAQPDGSYLTVSAPPGGWEPVGMVVSYPTEEQLASNSETPVTNVYVVMAHSGYQWQSNPAPPVGRDPYLRDMLVPSTNPATESSMLVSVDVTDPTYPVDLYPAGAPIAGAILGHGAGQPAFDPGTGSVYVGNMPSTSLPTTPAVPKDLTSFVSIIFGIASPAAEAGEAGAAPSILILCGPEHPEEGLLAGVPAAWACIAEGGEGPLIWEFRNLPSWLTAHPDKLTGQLDGIIYGTPTANGSYTFEARVTDYGAEPAFTSDWASFTLNVIPTGVPPEGEAGFEVGIPGATVVEGTGSCSLAPTASPWSRVPAWVEVATIPGRVNPLYPSEQTIGCVVMGTAPISGEYYEFTMPNFKFAYPWDREEVLLSGQVAGPYMFDPLPPGVTISGLAWHQIEKIHDPSTEADILNAEFIGVEPFTGQLYRILLPQGALEVGDVTGPPELSVELDEISAEGSPLLGPLTTARPDIAAALSANPALKVKFGDLVVEADRDIFVTAGQIAHPAGASPTVIPIGGAAGAPIASGAVIKVSGGAASAIGIPGVQAYFLGLNSNLAPAIPGSEPGQVDHGVLWVTGTNTGNVAVVDTTLGQFAQQLSVAGASSLGGVSVDPVSGFAYVAGKSLRNVSIFGAGTPPAAAPHIWCTIPEGQTGCSAILPVGRPGSVTVLATGSPTPTLSKVGTLPSGVTFVDNGNGTANFTGTPAAGTEGDYPLTITAANGVLPNATVALTLTVGTPTTITSPNTAAFAVGLAGSFTVTATGNPVATLAYVGALPAGVTFADNEDGTATLAGTPAAGTAGVYPLTITATNGVPPDATQTFTLTVTGPASAPVITSGNSTTFNIGAAGSFTVRATGSPTPTLSQTGALPGGVTFTNNGNGTATLAGTPAAGTAGSYPFTITASNGVAPNATQIFTLTVNTPGTAPAITSASTTTFSIGLAGSFTVTATGSPTPTLSYAGGLPRGVTFTPNANGSATLAGSPGAGSVGSYIITITASNGVLPNATQYFTLTVNEPPPTAPTITSANSATFTVGSAGSFTVTTTGVPKPSLSYAGALPSGLTFVNNGDGTAALAGVPGPGTAGRYTFNITASNWVLPNAAQAFTLIVNSGTNAAPAITSANATSFSVGSAGSFTVTTTGSPTPTLSYAGTLPGGVTFTPNSNGTATLAGTPAAGSAGSYPLTITASNGVLPNATQTFTLTVSAGAGIAPAITSANTATFTVGAAGSFTVTATGSPTPTLSHSGTLPAGVNFTNNGNGTATLAGTPAAGTAGSYPFTISASNGTPPNATQNFVLTVTGSAQTAPAITSGNSTTFTVGSAGSFLVTTTGSPTPNLSYAGALPGGVTFTNNGNGTATLAGTPAAGTIGAYSLTIRASNWVLPNAAQNFTLVVSPAQAAPAITSGGAAAFTVGSPGTFMVTATGSPTPTLSYTGTLPGGVTFTPNSNGTAILAGTPAAGSAGSYPLTITASNGVPPNATQNFTLTVSAAGTNTAPAITSAATTTFMVGSAGSFTVTATGSPTPTLSVAGELPRGVTFTNNGNGTATLAGVPRGAASYLFTITASNGVLPNATQYFTLVVSAPASTPPTITSASAATFTVGSAGSFTVTTTGWPTPSLSLLSALPSGVMFTLNGDGTANLAGTPAPGTAGTYVLTIAASNWVLPNAVQTFTLTVNP